MRRTIRFALPAAALIAGGVVLTACGSSSGSHDAHSTGTTAGRTSAAPSGTATANGSSKEADVSFATGMIPHHAQAIEMADMAAEQATNAEVKKLAAAVRAAQDPEITTMTGWLTTWGKPVPTTGGEHAGHDMDGSMTGSMTGMMSQPEMDQLHAASGMSFDRMWLTMMTKHHQGAIAMAQQEITAGSYPPAQDLARSIVTSQGKEIATMQQLLSRLG